MDPVPGYRVAGTAVGGAGSDFTEKILTIPTEFSSQLEGYENVRAYCYNCEF